MPNPQDLNSYNFTSNPFAQIIGGEAGGSMPSPSQSMPAQSPPSMPAMSQSQQGMSKEGMQEEVQEQTQLDKGVSGGATKYLMGAVNQIERFLAESTDKEDLMMGRAIVTAISKLMSKDQERLSEELQMQ